MTPGPQARQVELAEARVVELGDEHRRHAVQRGAALVGHRLERRERVERLGRDDHAGAVTSVQARLPITMPKQW